MARMDEAPTPDILYTETANASIVTPASGNQKLFVDTDHLLKLKNSSGTVTGISGMSNVLTTTGDTIYSSSGTTAARRAIGSTGDVYTVAGGVPTWAAPAAGSALPSPAYVASTADFTVANSASWVDVTGISVALTTGAHRVKITWSAYCYVAGGSGALVAVDATIDGTRVGGGTYGLGFAQLPTNGDGHSICFAVISGVLSAASHTFKVQARGFSAGGGVIYGSSGTGIGMMLIVEETALLV